jgi:glyoxylase-like metal-dependent hydrolase (beta-lactamase superfamily II)
MKRETMVVLVKAGGVAATNSILVADEAAAQAVLFDAPDHTVGLLLDEVAKRGWELSGLWLTHGHFDHFADHGVVRARFPKARILIHELDAFKVEHPDLQTRLFGLPFAIPPCRPDDFVTDGQRLRIGSIEVVAIHTPGHSPGHLVYHFPKENLLIGGDLIIGGSIGRTDLPDSDPVEMEASLRKVMALPDETRLLGGHGPSTTLGEQRRTNPFLQDTGAPGA